MPQQQPIIGVDMTQQDYNNLQNQGLGNIQPDQQLIAQSMASQQGYNLPPLQRPQEIVADVSPQTMAVVGANRNGVDWRSALGTLASYAGQIGQGMAGAPNMAQGLASGMSQGLKHQQNINQYNTMKPYYQQMGYDVTRLDPRRGGAGVASTPESMINLQSQVDQRNMNNLYRQQMIESLQQKQQGTQGGKVMTIGQLMMLSPEFKARMQGQYDFSGGQNVELLNQQIPSSLLQGYMPAKKVDMRYSGGLNSSKTSTSTIEHKTKEKPPKPVKPTPTPSKLKEGQTGNYNGKKVIVRNGAWQYQ